MQTQIYIYRVQMTHPNDNPTEKLNKMILSVAIFSQVGASATNPAEERLWRNANLGQQQNSQNRYI
jgi:hypothetical protein